MVNSLAAARVTVIVLSLGLSAAFIVFFLIAPLRNYPLSDSEAEGLLNIVVPVLSGYLASAAAFVFRKPDDTGVDVSPLTMFMLLATAVVFVILNVVLFTVFFYATKLQSDKAMTYPTLKNYFVLIFSIMTAVYALAIAHLFRGAGKHA